MEDAGEHKVSQQSLDSVLSSINPHFREHASDQIRHLIQPSELIAWSGDCGQFGVDSDLPFGYLLITSHRFIRNLYLAELDVKFGIDVIGLLLGVPISSSSKPKRAYIEVERVTGHEYKGDLAHFVVAPPTSPLTTQERKSRRIEEYPLSSLSSLERTENPVRKQVDRAPLVELSLRFQFEERVRVVFYEVQNSQDVYRLLQTSLQNQTVPKEQAGSIADQLEKLAELHRYQTITEEEYEAAKRRLLDAG